MLIRRTSTWFFCAFVLLVIFGLRFLSWQDLTQNRAETRPEHTNPELRTRHYQHSAEALFFALQTLINDLPRWQIIEADFPKGQIVAERKTRLFRFIDDIEIHIQVIDPEHASLDIRSASRIGKGDFGQNARNIQALFKGLEAQLSSGTDQEPVPEIE